LVTARRHVSKVPTADIVSYVKKVLDADATFVSLQKDPRPDDKAVLCKRTNIIDLSAYLTDFSETAALVNCLDLVITVDTSVAHLAGALGRPTLDTAALHTRLALAARS
jgi:ADP-heptose:LPS heptosyltransferase